MLTYMQQQLPKFQGDAIIIHWGRQHGLWGHISMEASPRPQPYTTCATSYSVFPIFVHLIESVPLLWCQAQCQSFCQPFHHSFMFFCEAPHATRQHIDTLIAMHTHPFHVAMKNTMKCLTQIESQKSMNHCVFELPTHEYKCIQEDIGLISRGHLELKINEMIRQVYQQNFQTDGSILQHTLQQNEKERLWFMPSKPFFIFFPTLDLDRAFCESEQKSFNEVEGLKMPS